jgi:hypothetical protein
VGRAWTLKAGAKRVEGACFVLALWRKRKQRLFPTSSTLHTQKPNEKGEAGLEGAPPTPEEEKKQKPARKQRMVEEIGVELVVLDLPDLPEDELARSVQK